MPSAAFQYFNRTTQDLASGVHNLGTDTLKIMLTDTAPVASNSVFGDLTEIAAGNGYTAGGTAITGQALTLAGSTSNLTGSNVTFTASGGSIGPFRYAVLYNSTAASGPLLGFWDYGSELTLADTEGLIVDLSGGILTVSHA